MCAVPNFLPVGVECPVCTVQGLCDVLGDGASVCNVERKTLRAGDRLRPEIPDPQAGEPPWTRAIGNSFVVRFVLAG